MDKAGYIRPLSPGNLAKPCSTGGMSVANGLAHTAPSDPVRSPEAGGVRIILSL